ncbi:hypothetical protein EDD11_009375 [Mortierella claussenii]|nr:hypothetical protein EDD11_009375 [Mortierella claussenii]
MDQRSNLSNPIAGTDCTGQHSNSPSFNRESLRSRSGFNKLFKSWVFRRGSAETCASDSTMIESSAQLAGTSEDGKEGSGMSENAKVAMDRNGTLIKEDEVDQNEVGEFASGMDMRDVREGGVSTFKAVASLICVIAGTGTLGMAHAVAQSGWFGICLVFITLFMSTTTGNMLVKCLYLRNDIRRHSYQQIARDAYGRPGYYFACGAVGLNLFGTAVLYVILAATLIETMVRDYGGVSASTFLYVMGCAFFVWVCLICTKSMKEVALLSIVGAGATVGVVMITVGVSADLMLHKAAEVVSANHKFADWPKMPLALATISFAYGGNVVYPHVEETMRYPRSWSKALWIALSACFVLYMTISVVGYQAFGSATMSPILKNLPRGAWSIIANSLITLHVLLAAPILLTSLAMMIESGISSRSSSFARGSVRKQFLKRAIPRTIIILFTAFVASVIPFFGDVMDLLGALTTCLLVFLLPIMFFYRLGGMKTTSWPLQAWIWFIFVIAMMAMVLGTIDATRHLIDDFNRH